MEFAPLIQGDVATFMAFIPLPGAAACARRHGYLVAPLVIGEVASFFSFHFPSNPWHHRAAS